MDLRAAALQLSAAPAAVASVIPGTANLDQARANIDLMQEGIPAAFWAAFGHDGAPDPEVVKETPETPRPCISEGPCPKLPLPNE